MCSELNQVDDCVGSRMFGPKTKLEVRKNIMFLEKARDASVRQSFKNFGKACKDRNGLVI